MTSNHTQQTDREKAEKWWKGKNHNEKQLLCFGRFRHMIIQTLVGVEIEGIWRKETLPTTTGKEGELTPFQKQIIEAYVWIRKNNNTIPDDVLDYMCNASLRFDEVYEALETVSPLLDGLINQTPTSKQRDELCDMNIKVKTALLKANKTYKP